MFFIDPVPSPAQITKDVSFSSKVLLPSLAALVPMAMSAAFRWGQDHSHSRRRIALTDRMSALFKMIADTPEVAIANMGDGATTHTVLTAELISVTRELASLQVRADRHMFSSATARMRAALLLYLPHGALAWALHIIFYLYFALLIMGMTSVLMSPHDPEFWTGILGFAVMGIPPLIIRYFAARLHRSYCAQQAAAAAAAAGPFAVPAMPSI